MILTFGKYPGHPLETVPSGYLRWLQGVARTDGLRGAIAEELTRRGDAVPAVRPLLRDLSPEGRALAATIVTRGVSRGGARDAPRSRRRSGAHA